MKINTNTKRHGKAVAIEFWDALERCNGPMVYGEPASVKHTKETLGAYLLGYEHAAPAARSGFQAFFGDYLSMVLSIGTPNVEKWRERRRMRGPSLSARESKAHARVWLKGGGA